MSKNEERPTVPAPFEDPKADIVLKTSDGVEIRSYKVLLSLASPVFETMLALPQSAEGPSPPIVEFQDDSKKLIAALRWIDHRVMPSLEASDLLGALLIADKYEMTYTLPRVHKALMELLKSGTTDEYVFRTFGIAYKLRSEDLLQRAARCTLSIPVQNRPLVQEFELIPATAAHQLTNYYNTCRKRVKDDLDSVAPTAPMLKLVRQRAPGNCREKGERVSPWASYLVRLTTTYDSWAPLHGKSILEHGPALEKHIEKCATCCPLLERFIRLQSDTVQYIEELLDKVGNPLTESTLYLILCLVGHLSSWMAHNFSPSSRVASGSFYSAHILSYILATNILCFIHLHW